MLSLYCCLVYAANNSSVFQPWSDKVFIDIRERFGNEAEQRARHIHQLLLNNQEASTLKKLELTNDTLNYVPWIKDEELWKKADYWATPMETLVTYGGDCEDIAIGKYVMLKALGIPEDRLNIAYVLLEPEGLRHMILTYDNSVDKTTFNPNNFLVLDNFNRNIMTLGERKDISVVYLFNEDQIDIAKANENTRIKYANSDKLINQNGIRDRIVQNRQYYRNINEGRPLFPLENMDFKLLGSPQ